MAIVSLICSTYCVIIFKDIQNGSSSASLMNAGLIIALVSDALWLGSIIFNTATISKSLKATNAEELLKSEE